MCDAERLFFFFQAEDGIRDIGVTGVQTCALPIFRARSQMRGAVENAREQVAHLLRANHADEIVFTSGGSESDNWAIGGFLEQRSEERRVGKEGRSTW